MPKNKQDEAANHIRELLSQRKLDISSQRLTLPNNQQWVLFEYKGRQLGIDMASGIWIRESDLHDWRCVSMPSTVSGAIQAVDFLTQD